MNILENLSLTRLTNLEFGQHIKSVKSEEYDRAMKYIAKSDETVKITAADVERDNLIVTIQRQLSVFEFSKDENKRNAYLSLTNLFNVYKGLKNWNYEEESNGIDNLIVDMESEKYSESVELLGMTGFKDELNVANDKFKSLFNVEHKSLPLKKVLM